MVVAEKVEERKRLYKEAFRSVELPLRFGYVPSDFNGRYSSIPKFTSFKNHKNAKQVAKQFAELALFAQSLDIEKIPLDNLNIRVGPYESYNMKDYARRLEDGIVIEVNSNKITQKAGAFFDFLKYSNGSERMPLHELEDKERTYFRACAVLFEAAFANKDKLTKGKFSEADANMMVGQLCQDDSEITKLHSYLSRMTQSGKGYSVVRGQSYLVKKIHAESMMTNLLGKPAETGAIKERETRAKRFAAFVLFATEGDAKSALKEMSTRNYSDFQEWLADRILGGA